MKIEVDEDYDFVLKEVFSGICLVSQDEERFAICMRDSGFEFKYNCKWYEAKEGILKEMV